MRNKIEVLVMVLAVVFLLVLLGIGPFLTIFALNALFQLHVAYTIGNWFAVFWLSLLFLPKCISK